MDNRMKAAVIGGAAAGVLSGLPIISGCCFLWGIGGGFLAVFMYMKNAPVMMTPGDGAKLGVTAGVVAGVVSLVLGLPFLLLGIGSAAMQNADLERAGIGTGIMAAGGFVGLVIRAGVVLGFTVLGGVIGAAVLGKNRPGGTGAPPPPPPPDYGTGGGYGGTTPGGGYGGGTAGSDFGSTTGGGTAGTGGSGSTFGTGS